MYVAIALSESEFGEADYLTNIQHAVVILVILHAEYWQDNQHAQ